MKKTNEINPIFNVGDCIVSKYDDIAFIESIDDKIYNLLCIDGFHEKLSIGYVNRNWHLWSIEDAKDGDVLIWEDGWTCIFKCIHGIWFSSYCFIDCDGVFHKGYEEHEVDSTINGSVNIATKEQRNLFLTRMQDAGWYWNAEDKKIEPKNVELDELLSDLDKEMKDFITTDEFDRDSAIGGHYWAIAKHAFLLGVKHGNKSFSSK